MSLPVFIETDALRLEVWPSIGGKVSSIIDKADNHELLFTLPSEIPVDQPHYDRPYHKSWYIGWDECMPAVGPGAYPRFPYAGIAVPDHGEIWGLPTTAVPTKNGITTVWHGLRFGYRLTRKLYLEDNRIIAEYSAANLSPFGFSFVWAQHALLSMKDALEIDLPRSAEFRFSHEAAAARVDRMFLWPKVEGASDLSHPSSLPAGKSWKVFSHSPIAAPAVIRYPERKRRLTMEYVSPESNLNAYWGIWINTGGWNGHRHVAVQPTTGRFDEIDRSSTDESAASLAAMDKLSWTVTWTIEGV